MRRQAGVFLAALSSAVILLVLSASAQGQAFSAEEVVDEDPNGAPCAAGELIVTYKKDISEKKTGEIKREEKAEVEGELPEIDAQVFEFPELKNKRAQKVRQ